MPSKVLVTGGTGFIGLNLIRRLAKDGVKVRMIARRPEAASPHGALDGLGVEVVKGDILDYGSVRAALDGVDQVYHVAGLVSLGPFKAKELTAANVTGTEIVTKAALDAGVKRLVHTSTVSTCACGTIDAPSDETTVYSGLDVPYFRTKRQGELVALAAGERGRMEVVVVNPSFVVGAWDVKPTSGEVILLAAKIGGIPFYAGGGMNVIDVDDVVAGHIAAMARGRPGERYILGNENFTHRGFIELLASTLDLRKPIMQIFEPAAYPFTIWGDLLGPFFPAAFENFNSFMLKVIRVAHFVKVDKARNELGLPATPPAEAIRKAYAWFAAVGRLKHMKSLAP